MKKAVLFLAVSVLMLMISCGDDQPTKVNENEKILQIKQRILRDAPGYHKIELIVDSDYAQFKKDSVSELFPAIDTVLNISESDWNILTKSFNMGSIMALDSFYVSGLGSVLVTLEITSNQRTKKVMFEYPPNINQPVIMLDSLNKLLNAIVEGL